LRCFVRPSIDQTDDALNFTDTSPAPPAPSAGAVQRSKSVEGWVMAFILKTAAAWSILGLAMVNRYIFVVVNRECGTGESLHIRHGQS
jgi:hypothetical protein